MLLYFIYLIYLVDIFKCTADSIVLFEIRNKLPSNCNHLNKMFPLMLTEGNNKRLKEIIAAENLNSNVASGTVDVDNNIPYCLICFEKIEKDTDYNIFNIVCCQLGSVPHYYHLKCFVIYANSQFYNVGCAICRGDLKDYWPVHIFNLMFMCYKDDQDAIKTLDNTGIIHELAKGRPYLHRYADVDNSQQILLKNIDIFLNITPTLILSDFIFNITYICDLSIFNKLTHFEFDRIINNKSHKFMISGEFIDYLSFEYLSTLDQSIFYKIIETIINSNNNGICDLYTRHQHLIKFAILNFDNESVAKYCLYHGKLLLQRYDLNATKNWYYLFNNIVFIENKYMKTLLYICIQRQFSYFLVFHMVIFAAKNSDISFEELRSIVVNFKVIADKFKVIIQMENYMDLWKDFLNTEIPRYFNSESNQYIANIVTELKKYSPILYYNLHFSAFYEFADYIYNRCFCFNIYTGDDIGRTIKYALDDDLGYLVSLYIHFSVLFFDLEYQKMIVDFCLNENSVYRIDKFVLLIIIILKKEHKVFNNMVYLQKILLFFTRIINNTPEYYTNCFNKENFDIIFYSKFNSELIMQKINGLYIKEDYPYDPYLFPSHLLRTYCKSIKEKIHLEHFVSSMLNKKQYRYLISYLEHSNLSAQESFISTEIRLNMGMRLFVSDHVHNILNSENNIKYLIIYRKQSIIPISILSSFPEIYLQIIFKIANRENNTVDIINLLNRSIYIIANHKDLDFIMNIVDFDLVINGLNMVQSIYDLFVIIFNNVKNDELKQKYFKKLKCAMKNINRCTRRCRVKNTITNFFLKICRSF